MDDPHTSSPSIVGIELARAVARGVRVLPDHNEIVAVAEVPLGYEAIDRDGVIEPAVVGLTLDTLLVHLGIRDRSQCRVGMTIGPRNAGVGSGPAMVEWLEDQAGQLRQPLVCSGGLGVAFAPIRSVDQAVKTSFDVGVELVRIDLAPVAAVRAVGEQIDDLICVGSGRGWQARMRDFEVLEAMENIQIGADEPVTVVGRDGTAHPISRYGWIDLSLDLIGSGRVDTGRFATAVGAALGVLYESPANLLEGRVIGARSAPARPHRSDGGFAHQPRSIRPEQTLQLAAVPLDVEAPMPSPAVTGELVMPPDRSGGRVVARHRGRGVEAPGRSASATAVQTRPGTAAGHGAESGWDDDYIAADDPINLFSPDTDVAHILGKRRFRFGFGQMLVFLAVLAAGLAAAFQFV